MIYINISLIHYISIFINTIWDGTYKPYIQMVCSHLKELKSFLQEFLISPKQVCLFFFYEQFVASLNTLSFRLRSTALLKLGEWMVEENRFLGIKSGLHRIDIQFSYNSVRIWFYLILYFLVVILSLPKLHRILYIFDNPILDLCPYPRFILS